MKEKIGTPHPPSDENSLMLASRKVRTDSWRELYNRRRRELRSARAPITVEAVIARAQRGKIIRWQYIPWEEIGLLIKSAAEELRTPASMLSQPDFSRPLELLGGNRSIHGLYNYLRYHPERERKDIMSFLLEKTGISITDGDLIEHIKRGGKVMWGRIPPEARRPFLEKLAKEVGQPASMLGSKDLSKPFNLLNGQDVSGIYGHAYTDTQREGKDTMLFLLEECGITATAEDLIQRMKSGHPAFWDRLSWEEIGDLLKRVADELDKPASTLGSNDFCRPLKLLGEHALGGLTDHLRRNGQRPTVASILEKAGLSMTVDDVVTNVRAGNIIPWPRVPWEVTGKLLELAAEELGIPVSMMTTDKFDHRFSFLGNRTLQGLYWFLLYRSGRKDQSVISFLFEQAKINASTQDVIERMKHGLPINWDRIPAEAIGNLVEMAAEETGLPATAIGYSELDRPLRFLNNRRLTGLYGYYSTHPERGDKNPFAFLLEKTGITISVDGIMARIKSDRKITWERVPWSAAKELLHLVSEEKGLPDYMLTSLQLRQSLQFLNEHTLKGFYDFCLSHPEKNADETTIAFIRRKIGLAPLPTLPTILTRANYRMHQMQDLFNQQVLILGSVDHLTVEEFMPWMQSVAYLYQNSTFDINKDEVLSELFIFISEELQGKERQTADFVKNIHRRLEQQISKSFSRQYREKSLSLPIVDSLTLEGVIGKTDTRLEEVEHTIEEVSPQLQVGLKKLSSLQKKLIYGITIEEKTFEDMESELGMNVDTLQEHYNDALAILRKEAKVQEDI